MLSWLAYLTDRMKSFGSAEPQLDICAGAKAGANWSEPGNEEARQLPALTGLFWLRGGI